MNCVILLSVGVLVKYLVSSTPIVNGIYKPIEPSVGAFPYHANIMDKYFILLRISFCGGSLIHPRWILTAAHCLQYNNTEQAFKPSDLLVGLGSIYPDSRGGQIIGTKSLSIYPSFLETDRDDIGLIELKMAALLGPRVSVIPLYRNNKETFVGKTVYLSGFGTTNDLNFLPKRLRIAILHVGDYDNCFDDMTYSSVEICTTSTIFEGIACRGDSGGALVIYENNTFYQIGVVSRALFSLCSLEFNYSIHTRVSAYIDWISNVTRLNF